MFKFRLFKDDTIDQLIENATIETTENEDFGGGKSIMTNIISDELYKYVGKCFSEKNEVELKKLSKKLKKFDWIEPATGSGAWFATIQDTPKGYYSYLDGAGGFGFGGIPVFVEKAIPDEADEDTESLSVDVSSNSSNTEKPSNVIEVCFETKKRK